MNLELGTIGKITGKIPTSLATCWDFVGELGGGLTSGQTYHLYAAAIGAYNQSRKLPSYPYLKGDPIGYGHGIFEILLNAGMTPAEIIELGSPIITEMLTKITGATEKEVEEKTDFS